MMTVFWLVVVMTAGSLTPSWSAALSGEQGKCEVLLHTGAVIFKWPGEEWTENCVTVRCKDSGDYEPVSGKAECVGRNGECHPVSSTWTEDGMGFTCLWGLIPRAVALTPQGGQPTR